MSTNKFNLVALLSALMNNTAALAATIALCVVVSLGGGFSTGYLVETNQLGSTGAGLGSQLTGGLGNLAPDIGGDILPGDQAKMDTERETDDVTGLSYSVSIAGPYKTVSKPTVGVDAPFEPFSGDNYATSYSTSTMDRSTLNSDLSNMPDHVVDVDTSWVTNHNYIAEKAPQIESGYMPPVTSSGQSKPCDLTTRSQGNIKLTVCTVQEDNAHASVVVAKDNQTVAIVEIYAQTTGKQIAVEHEQALSEGVQRYNNGEYDSAEDAASGKSIYSPSMPHLRYAVNHLDIK